ncbi:hypothetical protein CCANI_02505 [Corynebacterium canis]|nr:hypothetical protein CCANI_02505 [Corynebacterium canis]
MLRQIRHAGRRVVVFPQERKTAVLYLPQADLTRQETRQILSTKCHPMPQGQLTRACDRSRPPRTCWNDIDCAPPMPALNSDVTSAWLRSGRVTSAWPRGICLIFGPSFPGEMRRRRICLRQICRGWKTRQILHTTPGEVASWGPESAHKPRSGRFNTAVVAQKCFRRNAKLPCYICLRHICHGRQRRQISRAGT